MNVLLVEDDLIIQSIHKIFLERMGCDVRLATNGKEALDQVNEQIDLVLMDIGLPDISGVMVAEKIRDKETKRIPIIFLTAFAGDKFKKECLAACDADGFYTKPIGLAGLTQVVAGYKLQKKEIFNDTELA